MTPVTVTLPLALSNPLNGSHSHWSSKARQRKRVRVPVALALSGPLRRLSWLLGNETDTQLLKAMVRHAGGNKSKVSHDAGRHEVTQVVVTVTRIAPSSGLDPHDGLPAACKPVVDGVADALGVDDRDPRVEWRYTQERGRPKEYAVRVTVEAR